MRVPYAGVLVLLLAASASAKDTSAPAEAKAKTETANEIASFVTACAQGGAKSEGQRALDEARSLDASGPGVKAATAALDALTDDASGAGDVAATARKSVGPKVAKAYDKLSSLDHDA